MGAGESEDLGTGQALPSSDKGETGRGVAVEVREQTRCPEDKRHIHRWRPVPN